MPMHFAPVPPGVLGDDLREARGGHSVHLRGESLALLEMVPELAAVAVDAAPPNVNTKVVPYGKVSWIISPTLIADREDLPLQPLVFRHVVEPLRLGIAFEVLRGTHGLDTTPCSMSVARARLAKLAKSARLIDPVPFTVPADEWYRVQLAPVGGAPMPAVPAVLAPPSRSGGGGHAGRVRHPRRDRLDRPAFRAARAGDRSARRSWSIGHAVARGLPSHLLRRPPRLPV
jgi:hypothetical protein